MSLNAYNYLINELNKNISPLADTHQYDSLLEKIGDARFVLIGEASHGTHEFYQHRINISKQLILQKGFMAIAIEGDWPDAYRIHRYIQGKSKDKKPEQALNDFQRFPTWMWRNTTIPSFLKWLKTYNNNLTASEKIGFYGLDLYSMYASMQAVIDYLQNIDPEAAVRAKKRYSCFDHMALDPQQYGYLTQLRIKKNCIKEAIEQLLEMQQHAYEYLQKDGLSAQDKLFYATQNARLVKNAEKYYRSMFADHISSWNVRDAHMAETLNLLIDHLEDRTEKPVKIIIWAHNSHVGDARATEMSEREEINIGQLIREQHAEHTFLLGFSTYQGFVTAASEWDAPSECKRVNKGLPGSYEALFHDLNAKNFILNLRDNEECKYLLNIPRLQRAIGVIYLPETERMSHYYFTRLPYQFDSIIHIDETTAVQPFL